MTPIAAVVGAGKMGTTIAAALQSGGCEVAVYDNKISTSFEAAEMLMSDNPSGPRVAAHRSLEECLKRAEYVFECAPEEFDLKRDLIHTVASLTSNGVAICTNTSSLSLEELARDSDAEERVLGVHWFFPADVIPGVEIAQTTRTSSQLTERVTVFLQEIGKIPILVKPAPGYVANRLHEALVAEAIRCVEAGLADPKDIDRIVRYTFGPRLAAVGPFRTIDFTGLEVQRAALQNLFDECPSDTFKVGSLLQQYLSQGRGGVRSGHGFYETYEPCISEAQYRSVLTHAYGASLRKTLGQA